MFTLLILFQAGDVALSATINGSPQCDLCSLNNQLLQKVNDLNKGQSAIKGLIGQIIKPACKFDFEGGINDWDKTGTAFNNQPTYDDNPTARNRGQPASQQGDWWIGGYENRPSKSYPAGRIQGDRPLGTLTSPYFTITGPFISFLIGGGCDINTVRAELIIDNKVVFKETGKCTETMTSKTWHVGTFVGQRARVRLIDFSSGGWGHINFDDLRGDISCE